MLAAQELLDEPASERLLSEATLVWHLHVSEADADERKRLRLDAPQSARLGAMLLLHDPTPELLGLIGRIAAVLELVATFAVTCGLLLRHLRTESAGGSGVTPTAASISSAADGRTTTCADSISPRCAARSMVLITSSRRPPR